MAFCIFGAGGHAKDLAGQIISEFGNNAIVCFVDEFSPGRMLLGLPVRSFDESTRLATSCEWLVAIGDPARRRQITERIARLGLVEGRFVSSRAYIAPNVMIGVGAQIFAGTALSVDATVGRGVIVNFNCSVSHDVSIGDFTTLSPSCSIAGRVQIESDAFLGIGVVSVNGTPDRPLTIGQGTLVGAGAVVTKSIPPGQRVVGIPARPHPG
jgi:sugar O-acyltransferase (sialic acid O-acetyltransferase NeuD family)